jgi:hypothetical protein
VHWTHEQLPSSRRTDGVRRRHASANFPLSTRLPPVSARTPSEWIGSPRRENGATALKRALAGESAANLGRLGRAVERTLARLRDVSEAERQDAEYACAEAVWGYFVQREACGLVGHDTAIEAYYIPASVLAKVGAQRPPIPGAGFDPPAA